MKTRMLLLLVFVGLMGPTASRAVVGEVPDGLDTSDWNSIRAEYERHRHAAFPVEGGYRARNFSQQWVSEFDGRGFLVTPDSGDWKWGLQLQSYGWAGRARAVTDRPRVTVETERVSYDWDENLREWYVNDGRGLEHGFTVLQPPAGQGETLELNLAVRGGLEPRVRGGGRAVAFVDADGRTALIYAGLKVWDADRRTLDARLEAVGGGLQLKVKANGARYPLTIDPIVQQAYLKASNADENDRFGESVAISGDTVVVGAISEGSNATGVNGNQGDNSAYRSGAVYVFVRNGGVWSQQAYLKASNTSREDFFGTSVAISGNTVVVGAKWEASNATGVNGNQEDNSSGRSGAAYVFERNGGVWSQQAYLKASNTDPLDQFGFSVAISGDTVVVGAVREASNATGVNGNQSDNSADYAGAAYVFVRNGGVWSQQAYLKASNISGLFGTVLAVSGGTFGGSVAISGDTVVVGAVSEASNATGVNGNQGDKSAYGSGAAYVYVRNGGVWSQQAYLKASNTDSLDAFGSSVAISGDTVVVGAEGERSNATGVNGNQSDNSADGSGSAYVFVRIADVWNQQAYLKASNTGKGDEFGGSVAISGDTVVVGAGREASNATGVNGNQSDNSAPVAGSVYVFVRNGGGWSQQAYLKASNTGVGGGFGWSVAISGDTTFVGAALSEAAYGFSMDQPSCAHSLSHSEEFFLSNGGTGTVDVVTAADCSWVASSNTPFLTILSVASGTGNGTVTYAVDVNPSLFVRTGTLDIAGLTFTVTQEGTADCVYFPSGSAEFFPANGGAGSVDIVTAAGCPWVASSNTPFLTILSGASGTGNGTVRYAVQVSPSASARTGTLNIAGLTFSVFQDGTTSLPEGSCVNIAGVWEGEESGTLACTLSAFGETEASSDAIDGSTSVMIQQAPGACSFSYDVSSPGGGTFPKSIRNGEINGYRLTFSGVAGIPLPGVTLSSNTMEGVGQVQGDVINISGFGVIKGTAPLPDSPSVTGNVSCVLTTTAVLTHSAKPPPLVTSVVSGSSFLPGIVAGSWVTIFGENFSDGVYLWGDAIIDGVLPTELGAVTVTINGKPAAIWFLRSGQINVQAPADDATGLVDVIVTRNGVSSARFLADLRTFAPSFFRFDPEGRKYLASVHTDNTFIGKDGLFGGALTTRPVRPGDRVLLFGNGFGPTNPPTPTGVIPPVAPTVADVRITIGGIGAIVEFAGIVGAGLYQFNVIIPGGLAAGDAEVIAQVGGVQTPGGGFLTVGP